LINSQIYFVVRGQLNRTPSRLDQMSQTPRDIASDGFSKMNAFDRHRLTDGRTDHAVAIPGITDAA